MLLSTGGMVISEASLGAMKDRNERGGRVQEDVWELDNLSEGQYGRFE